MRSRSSSRTSKRCFCAFCRTERLVYIKRHVGLIDAFLALAAALLVSFMIWNEVDPRAIVFFVAALAIAEVFVIFRWRLSIGCPHCGFDPVIYKRSREAAAARVKEHMDRRRDDPRFAFSPPPKLPFLIKPRASQEGPPAVPAIRAGMARSIDRSRNPRA